MPLVSFIVPCYRLAHLVADCVSSILNQTFTDLEVLVMDDCSPDDVAGALRPLEDRRLRHIRNETNLGHLRNYNRGIELARGEYVWLISADDRLCRADGVESLVRALALNPNAGFAFSPAIKFGDTPGGRYGCQGRKDRLFSHPEFAVTMIHGNPVPAPAGLVRGEHYRAGLRFPLDLPFVGDWYIWGHLALRYDVAYVAEPVAEYRLHDGNMTKQFRKRPPAMIADEVAVRWRLMGEAEALGLGAIADEARDAIAWDYANRVGGEIRGNYFCGMTIDEFDHSLAEHCRRESDAAFIRGRVYSSVADVYRERGDRATARAWYDRSLGQRRDGATWLKRRLLDLGSAGDAARQIADSARDARRRPRA